MKRPELKHRVYMEMAKQMSRLSTCERAQHGCVGVESSGALAGAGYNGSAPGQPHCTEVGCLMHEGHCIRCTHAELNMILRARSREALQGCTVYVTGHPCPNCVRECVQVGVARVYFERHYRSEDKKALIDELRGDMEIICLEPESPSLSFSEYVEGVESTMGNHPSNRDALSNWALGLAGETGEVIELIKKYVHQKKPLRLDLLQEELGDVLWYLAAVAKSARLSLPVVATTNLLKLQKRYPDGWVPGGGERDLKPKS